eukprot:COSAG01_NODE_2472_length_7625_cov_9.664895_4_plen_89_part_00
MATACRWSTAPSISARSGAVAVASFWAAGLTEIYLCNVCSCQEISRRNGRGQGALGAGGDPHATTQREAVRDQQRRGEQRSTPSPPLN